MSRRSSLNWTAPATRLLAVEPARLSFDLWRSQILVLRQQDSVISRTFSVSHNIPSLRPLNAGLSVSTILATLIVETSLLSFVPYSNQSSLCSSILSSASDVDSVTASSYPSPGGCPYGPGPVLIGYNIPLGSLGDQDYYPLSTLSTRLRILDTSVPPLQLACVDVYTTPYYSDSDPKSARSASALIYDLILWLPVAVFISYVVINTVARVFSAYTTTRQEREAALASSLSAKLNTPTPRLRVQEILLETAIGRSIVRSRSLTRFVTPCVGDVLGELQWMALIGMCGVQWQGFAYPIFARLGWSMLVFSKWSNGNRLLVADLLLDTTIIGSEHYHTDPSASTSSYPPAAFRLKSASLFDAATSPFHFSSQATSNLLNIPSSSLYNNSDSTISLKYPSVAETQGLSSFAWQIGLQPQNIFANSLVFFAILLAVILILTLFAPMAGLAASRVFKGLGGYHHAAAAGRQSKSSFGKGSDLVDQIRPNGPSFGSAPRLSLNASAIDRTDSNSTLPHDDQKESGSASSSNYVFGGLGNHKDGHVPNSRSINPVLGHGINRWWAGNDRERNSGTRGVGRRTDLHNEEYNEHTESSNAFLNPSYGSVASWFAFSQGFVIRLVLYFHLPITVFSVYQLAHADTTSSTVSIVLAALVFLIFSLAIPVFLILRIRKTLTRYLQDDTNTLLAYGPAYNAYAQDSYTFSAVRFTANLVEGCVVGGAQHRATVQVAVILAVEIVETLVTVS